MFSAHEGERKTLAQDLVDVALKYWGQVNFATLDAAKHPFFLQPFGLQDDQLPAFAIQTDNDIVILEQQSLSFAEAVDELIGRTLQSMS